MRNAMKSGSLVLALAVVVAAGASAAEPPAAAPAKPRPIDTLVYPKLHEIKMPAVVRETLPNGVKLLFVEDHDLPQIAFRAIVKGGLVAEPAGKAGLAELLGEVQRTGGTQAMSGDAIDGLLDRLGAQVSSGVGGAFGEVEGTALKESVDKVLPVFAQVLMSPAFAQEKIDLAKTHLKSAISRRNDDVFGVAYREFQKLVYGAKSPYARQFEYEDIDRLTREDLVAFHQAYYRPDATILAVWGDFNAKEMRARVAGLLGGWKARGPAPKIVLPVIAPQVPSLNYVEKKDVEQTFILAGQLGTRLDDPDYPAIHVMSDILGGGFSSRIFVKVRTEKGLAYAAGGRMNAAYDHVGAYYFFTSTKPSTTSETLSALLEEIRKIREAPVTDAELSRAKDGYLNGYAFAFDSTAKVVDRLMTYDVYGYPADFNVKLRDAVEKVTKDDVLRVAKTRLNPDALTILAVGRQDQFDKPLSTFGKVTTLDITIPEPKAAGQAADAAPTPESLARGKELLVKAAGAMGAEALKGLKTLTTEGAATLNTPGGAMELKVKASFVLPDRLHNQMTTPMGAMAQVLDGEKAWMAMGGNARDLPGSASAEMRQSLYTEAGCALLLKKALAGEVGAQSAGKVSFEGKEAEDLIVRLGEATAHLYLSRESGRIVGLKRSTRTQEGPAESVEVFSAHQAVSGLQIPFETTQKVNGEVKASVKLSSVVVNAAVPEELFKKPATP